MLDCTIYMCVYIYIYIYSIEIFYFVSHFQGCIFVLGSAVNLQKKKNSVIFIFYGLLCEDQDI